MATESEQLAYLFCFNLQAVARQQQERAVRVEQAEAQKKRKRRPCFNPSACKRRRRMQAAMDDAVSRPLTITFDPLDELFAHGWDLVDYEPDVRVTPKKKTTKQGIDAKQSKLVKPASAARSLVQPPEEEESVVSDVVVSRKLASIAVDSPLKSPMGAAAAKAGALMKNLVSSVGCALGYGGNGKKCDMVLRNSAPGSGPPTPVARRSPRVKVNDWSVRSRERSFVPSL